MKRPKRFYIVLLLLLQAAIAAAFLYLVTSPITEDATLPLPTAAVVTKWRPEQLRDETWGCLVQAQRPSRQPTAPRAQRSVSSSRTRI